MSEKDYSKEIYEKLSKLCDDFNRARLLEYIDLVSSPKRLFWLNFMSGVAKGLGLTIGTAIILVILFKMTQHLVALNIPYITTWIADAIDMVKASRQNF
ncbi:putative uncharacterized protein [Acetobacter sp. CAG:977]|nr:putative uncharacterized protein [Acetobacter sp. CAG:977]